MTKAVFMRTLSDRLVSVTPERIAPTDAVRFLDYYEEMIDDRMEDGMGEEEAVAAVGTPDDVFRVILADLPRTSAPKPVPVVTEEPPRKKRSPWLVVLLVVTAPVWIPLLVAGAAVVLSLIVSLYAVVWSLVVSVWAVFAGLAGGGALLIVSSVPLVPESGMPAALASLGMGLAAVGLSVFVFFAAVAVIRFAARLTVSVLRGAVSLFYGKERRS